MRWLFTVAVFLTTAFSGGAFAQSAGRGAIDYSICGGVPVYPVIGVNFGTFCGPRNQIGLGRRGRLMWLFPSADGRSLQHGERQLRDEELSRLVLLAEVAQLADTPVFTGASAIYDLGINFSGRPYKRVHGAWPDDSAASADALVQALRALVPDEPLLPICKALVPPDFSPTLIGEERRAAAAVSYAR